MNDPSIMGRQQGGADLLAHIEGSGRIDAAAFDEPISKADALEMLHHQIGAAVVVVAKIKDFDDPGVADRSGHLGLVK